MRETWNNEAMNVALEQFLIATMARQYSKYKSRSQRFGKWRAPINRKQIRTLKDKTLNNLVDSWANSNHSLEENKMQTDDLRIVAENSSERIKCALLVLKIGTGTQERSRRSGLRAI